MVSISSLLENNGDADIIRIYYINNDIGTDYEEKLSQLVHSFNREIMYIDAKKIDTSFITKSWFSVSGYYRILITKIINESKIIYLDCDTVVNGSFVDLWNTSLDGYLFGGVKDTVQNYVATSVGQPNNSFYINSGFLYINLEECRKIDFESKVKDLFAKYGGLIPHYDQGVINALGFGKIMYLSPKYNLTSQYLSYSLQQLRSLFSIKDLYCEDEIKKAVSSPIVIHYLNYFYKRPWEYGCTHPYLYLFEKYNRKYDIGIVLKNNNNSIGTQFRKVIYRYLPFSIHCLIEKMLDKDRKARFDKTFKTK